MVVHNSNGTSCNVNTIAIVIFGRNSHPLKPMPLNLFHFYGKRALSQPHHLRHAMRTLVNTVDGRFPSFRLNFVYFF